MVRRNYSDDPRIANYNKNRFLVASSRKIRGKVIDNARMIIVCL